MTFSLMHFSYASNYQNSTAVGLFIIGNGISRKNNSCTIKLLDGGNRKCITFGIGPEKYAINQQPGWKPNSCAFHGDDGS